jgi:hypothetical protein
MLVAVAGAGCEKSFQEPEASGALAGGDLDMFRNLPADGAQVIFGGNYMRLQAFMQKTGLDKMTEKLGKGMSEWVNCFGEMKDMKVAGTVSVKGKRGGDMRMIFSGMTLKDVEACAKRASFTSELASDGSFLTIEVPNQAGTQSQAYLKLKDGAIYFKQSMGGRVLEAPSRAELEADAALAAKGNAADDAKLQAIAAKADRTKTMWFAGTGAGTPLGDKVGEAFGSFDLTSGIAIEAIIEVTDSSLASQIEEGISQARKMADQLPGAMKDVINDLEFKRKGDKMRFALKLSDDKVGQVFKSVGGLMGGLGGRGGF